MIYLHSPTCGLMLLRKNVAHIESWEDLWLAAAARCPLSYPLFLKMPTTKLSTINVHSKSTTVSTLKLSNYYKPVVIICCRKQGMNWRITDKLTTPSIKISVVHVSSCQVLKEVYEKKNTLLRGVTWIWPATKLKIFTMFSRVLFYFLFSAEGNPFLQESKLFLKDATDNLVKHIIH